jgi:hypothetical protein
MTRAKREAEPRREWVWCERCEQHIEKSAAHGCAVVVETKQATERSEDNVSTKKKKAPEQLYFEGTEPPPDPARDSEADERVYAWLDAKAAQKKALDVTKIKHASMLERLGELKVERYPYTDQFSGKKRFVVVKRDPKAVMTSVPRAPKPRFAKTPRKSTKVDPAEQVEHRKVSRASVQAEIDPFGATRENMNGKGKAKKSGASA